MTFQDGSKGCACQIADPGIGSSQSSCFYNPTDIGVATTVCDPVDLHCRLPRDLETCGQVGTGTQNICDVGYTCVSFSETDGGSSPLCVQLCETTSDCQNPMMSCQANAVSVPLGDGGVATSACELNLCDAGTSAYAACDAAGTGDGQCLPINTSKTELEGICTRTGQMAVGQPCAPVGGACVTCAAGSTCSLSGTNANRDVCLPVCDATGTLGTSCQSSEVCAPFADQATTTPNPGVCEPVGAGASTTYPATHPAYPQIPNGGGPILANPEAVVITYNNYNNPNQANRAAIEQFMTSIVQSSWLTTVGADYGVGLGKADLVELNVSAPGANTNPNTITTELCNLIKTPPANFPKPNVNTVYMFFYPETTTFTDGSCTQYGGYHSYTTCPGVTGDIAYAVLPDCATDPATTQILVDYTDLQGVEGAASHELIEAATDPFINAFVMTDTTNPWYPIGGEVGDECVWNYEFEPFGMVQRIWSNSAAASKTSSPCVPLPDEPLTTLSINPDTVEVGNNQTFNFTITGWSDQPTQPFVITPFEYVPPTSMTFNVSADSLSNGQTATLSVNVPRRDRGDAMWLLFSEVNPGQSLDIWNWYPVIVCSDLNGCNAVGATDPRYVFGHRRR